MVNSYALLALASTLLLSRPLHCMEGASAVRSLDFHYPRGSENSTISITLIINDNRLMLSLPAPYKPKEPITQNVSTSWNRFEGCAWTKKSLKKKLYAARLELAHACAREYLDGRTPDTEKIIRDLIIRHEKRARACVAREGSDEAVRNFYRPVYLCMLHPEPIDVLEADPSQYIAYAVGKIQASWIELQ